MAQKRFDIDSHMFDLKTYFRDFVRGRGVEELIKKNNELFGEIKSLDGELQTLVYENYNKFISATDIIKNIKTDMINLDQEIDNLRGSLDRIGSSYAEVDDKLRYKWKEVRKLDCLEKDLNKLKLLSDLPEEFKTAIANFSRDDYNVRIFEKPIESYIEYKDVLLAYKDTVSLPASMPAHLLPNSAS